MRTIIISHLVSVNCKWFLSLVLLFSFCSILQWCVHRTHWMVKISALSAAAAVVVVVIVDVASEMFAMINRLWFEKASTWIVDDNAGSTRALQRCQQHWKIYYVLKFLANYKCLLNSSMWKAFQHTLPIMHIAHSRTEENKWGKNITTNDQHAHFSFHFLHSVNVFVRVCAFFVCWVWSKLQPLHIAYY